MRIVDEWNYGDIRVTAFHMNGKYSVKCERLLLEQWYKFRDGQVQSAGDLRNLLNEKFYDRVMSIFQTMDENRNRLFPSGDEAFQFDTIL